MCLWRGARDNRHFSGHDPPEFLGDLQPWLGRARTSLVASFANGVMKDQVAAAVTSGGSNDQTEGQITKLKLIKCQMYGRGKIDLAKQQR